MSQAPSFMKKKHSSVLLRKLKYLLSKGNNNRVMTRPDKNQIIGKPHLPSQGSHRPWHPLTRPTMAPTHQVDHGTYSPGRPWRSLTRPTMALAHQADHGARSPGRPGHLLTRRKAASSQSKVAPTMAPTHQVKGGLSQALLPVRHA